VEIIQVYLEERVPDTIGIDGQPHIVSTIYISVIVTVSVSVSA